MAWEVKKGKLKETFNTELEAINFISDLIREDLIGSKMDSIDAEKWWGQEFLKYKMKEIK